MFLVLLRGLVAGPIAGAGVGLVTGVPLALLSMADDPTVGLWVVGMGAVIGAAAGAVVGFPSALVLTVVGPSIRSRDGARLAGLVVAGLVGFVAVSVAGGGTGATAVVAGGVCAIVGSVVGSWVVLGPRAGRSR